MCSRSINFDFFNPFTNSPRENITGSLDCEMSWRARISGGLNSLEASHGLGDTIALLSGVGLALKFAAAGWYPLEVRFLRPL